MIQKLYRFIEVSRNEGVQKAGEKAKKYLISIMSEYYIKYLYSRIFEYKYGGGEYVMNKDWDNLILLDACRYDIFNQHTTLDGQLAQVVSRGNYSFGFMKENFSGENYHETVYVTANPFYEKLENDNFYTVIPVIDEWDSQTGTVLPNDVTEQAIKAANRYPNKRLIVHYMQPHLPHLGDIAQDINTDITGWDKYKTNQKKSKNKEGITMWEAYRRDIISKEQLRQSYIQTLNIVESGVQNLTNHITGKTVVSSDHGENLGEKYFWNETFGHRQDTKECRLVPWLELDYNERKKIICEEPIGYEQPDEDINQRLRDLGYL